MNSIMLIIKYDFYFKELLTGWLERSGISPAVELTSSDILETPIEELLDKIGIGK